VDFVTVPAEATSAAAARQMVRDALGSSEAGVREAAVLATSELVTNVVRHANTEVRVSIDAGPPIRVEVHDGVAATDAFRAMIHSRPASADARADGGRGLSLVHDLASRIGLGDDPLGGKVVWFEIDTSQRLSR
jgi:anti-sigma regulatory factor (Ser/Thr protein kinase)